MEDIVQQLSFLNENFVRINERIDSMDKKFESKIAIIERKMESYDKQFYKLKENNTNIERNVNSNKSKSSSLGFIRKRTTYCRDVSQNQASAVPASTSFRNCRVGVSPTQPTGNHASDETIELDGAKETPVNRGMVVRSHRAS